MFLAFGVATWAFWNLIAMPASSALAVPLWGWIEGAARFTPTSICASTRYRA